MKAVDISGVRFGRLIAIRPNGFDVQPSRNHIKWLCQCDCGSVIDARLNTLRSSNLQSCGCIKKSATHKVTHGMTGSPEYMAWAHLKARCCNKNSADYKLYGARGIKVSALWIESFESFYKDMGPRPSVGMSIDRIDANGDYEKGNCRWADDHTQSRNKRNNVFFNFNGKNMCQSDWAKHLGIGVPTLIQRLRTWTLEKSLSTFKEN